MDIIVCPMDKGALTLAADNEDDDGVVTGTLTCTVCGEIYPIEDSIPNLLPPELRAATS
jgi:uncharacterized protein YbaR (Trm112 family)